MFHLYNGYHFMGMHMLWWVFWFVVISGAFAMYEAVPRRRGRQGARP